MVRSPGLRAWLNSLIRCSIPSVALSIFSWCVLSSARSSSGVAGVDFENPKLGSRAQPIEGATMMTARRSAMQVAAPETDADSPDVMGPTQIQVAGLFGTDHRMP